MNRAKVVAFFREFPFLENLLNRNRIDSIHVFRVDRDLMTKTPWCMHIHPFGHVWSTYILLDKNGAKLTTVGIRPTERKWWRPSTWPGRKHFKETVGEAIARLGNRARQAFFIVYFNPMFENGPGDLILYKPPKGFTIQGWLEEEIRREQAAIQAESQAIDALAQQ